MASVLGYGFPPIVTKPVSFPPVGLGVSACAELSQSLAVPGQGLQSLRPREVSEGIWGLTAMLGPPSPESRGGAVQGLLDLSFRGIWGWGVVEGVSPKL